MIDKWDEVSVSEEFERCCSEVAAGEYVFFYFDTASSIRFSNRNLDGEPTVGLRLCPCLGDCVHRLQQHKECVETINRVNKYGFNVEDG